MTDERQAGLLREAATDGLAALITELLRKYGGTMKGRGDHRIFDALVRYRAALAVAQVPAQERTERTRKYGRRSTGWQPDPLPAQEECHPGCDICKTLNEGLRYHDEEHARLSEARHDP